VLKTYLETSVDYSQSFPLFYHISPSILCKRSDNQVVAITSNPTSTIAKYVLNYQEHKQRLFKYCDLSSQIPAMYIVEGLVEILIGKNQDLIKQKQDQEKEHE
jgi:DNA-binding MurR/RpiR family transcriptional regulator